MRKKPLVDHFLSSPWWLTAVLAGGSYIGLRYWLPNIETESHLFRTLASNLTQLAAPVSSIFALCAMVSGYRAWRHARKKKWLLESQTSIDSVRNLPWKEFEYLVSESYRRIGYRVQDNPSRGADGGVDITLFKGDSRLLVQCKNWRSRSVGVTTVRELYGIVMAEGASSGVIVCAGRFTRDAVEFSKGKPLTLVDGPSLMKLISSVQKTVKPSPPCPVCKGQMKLRTAKSGSRSGGSFWGCSKFPDCRGTRTAQ